MRILHIGKFFPPVTGGIESFLGDLLPALETGGVTTAAVVHDDVCQKQNPVCHPKTTLFRVPCYGTLLYAPISPAFIFVMRKAIQSFQPAILPHQQSV